MRGGVGGPGCTAHHAPAGGLVHGSHPACLAPSQAAPYLATAPTRPPLFHPPRPQQNRVADVLAGLGVPFAEEYSPRANFFGIDIAGALSYPLGSSAQSGYLHRNHRLPACRLACSHAGVAGKRLGQLPGRDRAGGRSSPAPLCLISLALPLPRPATPHPPCPAPTPSHRSAKRGRAPGSGGGRPAALFMCAFSMSSLLARLPSRCLAFPLPCSCVEPGCLACAALAASRRALGTELCRPPSPTDALHPPRAATQPTRRTARWPAP